MKKVHELKHIQKIQLGVYGILFVLFIICILILPVEKSTNFWISFIFTIITILIYCVWNFKNEQTIETDGFLNLPYGFIGFVILLLQSIMNGAILFLEYINIKNVISFITKDMDVADVPIEAFLDIVSYSTKIDVDAIKIFSVPVFLNVILNIIFLALYVLISFYTYYGIHKMKQVHTSVQQNTFFLKSFGVKLNNIRNSITDTELMKLLDTAIDKVKYGNPMSNENTIQIEASIDMYFMNFIKALNIRNFEQAKRELEEICILLEQRNSLCKR